MPSTKISALSASAALDGTEELASADGGANYRVTTSQVKTYVLSSSRTLLTTNTTFYVATTGSNVTGDGTVGNPWATPQFAFDTIKATYDLAGYFVTIQHADGTYSAVDETVFFLEEGDGWIGAGEITFQGNAADNSLVKWTTTGASQTVYVFCQIPGTLRFRNLQVKAPNDRTIFELQIPGGFCEIESCNVEGGAHQILFGLPGCYGSVQGDYDIVGHASGSGSHIVAQDNCFVSYNPTDCTIIGTPAFSTGFAYANTGAHIDSVATTFTGSSTGPRFRVIQNAIINTAGTPLDYFPGNAVGQIESHGVTSGDWDLSSFNTILDDADASTDYDFRIATAKAGVEATIVTVTNDLITMDTDTDFNNNNITNVAQLTVTDSLKFSTHAHITYGTNTLTLGAGGADEVRLTSTALSPDANDGNALGTTALGWSDLHLASGALINVANGNAIITHSSGVFNVSTGALQVGGTAVALQGRRTIWVPASDMTPAAANGAAATTRAINTITTEFLAFDTTTSESAYFNVAFPKSWNEGTVTAQVFWTTTGGGAAQTVEFEISGGCFANDAAINVTGIGTAVAHTDTWIADNDVHVTAEGSAITLSNAAVDTVAWFRIVRDVGNDTLAVDAELIGVKLFYTTDAGNDV
jgi:hypothetical protein